MLVQRVETIFTEHELARALIQGHDAIFSDTPTETLLTNAIAHVSLECERAKDGRIVKCRCYNLGNITVSQAQVNAGRDYWTLKCKEQLRDKDGVLTGEWKWFDMRFCANTDLHEGAVHYFHFFSDPKRRVALDGMRLSIESFAHGLSACWYMTANLDKYLKGLLSLQPNARKVARAAILEWNSDRSDTATHDSIPPEETQVPLLDAAMEGEILNLSWLMAQHLVEENDG